MSTNNLLAHELPRNIVKQSSLKRAGLINEGGIANIFDAYDRDGKHVVLRMLKPSLKFKLRMRGCFKQGVKVRRMLGGVPTITQYIGEGGSITPYEVIEHLPCSNLKQLIYRKDPVIREHGLFILEQIAEALAAVHSVGFLHLDVKPENVLVISGGNSVQVKLTDFDLCQPITCRTVPKDFGGSLAYLPPEYLSKKEVSVSTDMFAFGVLAYNMFTGQMPFVGSVHTNMHGGTYDVKFPITKEGEVQPPVKAFITRCLAQNVMHRFCDDNELRIGLRKLARGLEDTPTGKYKR